MTQKFFKGDLVQVGEMPNYMSHFPSECQAIVIATYTERYGKSTHRDDKQYSLYILKNGEKGEHSWYEENQLTFVEPDRFDLLPKSNEHRKIWEAKQLREQV